ncbi:MAG: DUF1499 domain-containing protein [bacterium]|nr:DUF1499 domain-containing protein [bacterium]
MKYPVMVAVIAISVMPLLSCTGKLPPKLGISQGAFAPCPSSPNCVSSDAGDRRHHIAPFLLALPPEKAWPEARELISGMTRSQIVTETADYLHVECRSFLFGFVDDLELHLRPAEGLIAVRSASRLGYSDLGLNRRRIEDLRASLIARRVLK